MFPDASKLVDGLGVARLTDYLVAELGVPQGVCVDAELSRAAR